MKVNLHSLSGRLWRIALCGLVSAMLLAFGPLPACSGAAATLTWNPGAATNVAGYKVYSGTASGDYSSVVAVGNVTQATLSGLVPGQTYYYVATTVDNAGHESGFSNEASYVVPEPAATLSSPVQAGGTFSFTVAGVTGQEYVVQASTNLRDWTGLQTNPAPFVFADTQAAGFSQRFYRTLAVAPAP